MPLKFYTINDFSGLAIVYRNMGKTYYIDKDYTLAQHNYILSEQFFNKTDLSTEKAELYYEMAKLNHVRREFNEAEKNVGKAIEMWKELSLFIPLKKALLLAAQINYSRGNYKMASQYYEQYIHYNDSIGEVEINKKITELSELFQSEQKEHKIAEQERVIKEEANQKIFIKNQLESEQLRNRFIVTLLISIVLFSIGIILVIRFKNNKQKLILRHKELELQQALLRTQMNPHFIFNTISVIQSHIYNQDNPTALRFLMEFSKLMRLVLENSAKEFIPLDKELEINQHYLELQKLRFGDRFEFIIENKIEDFGIMVPPMIVQPFIENAIEHAELGKVEHGKIYLQYAIIDHYLTIIISDNGIGRKNAAKTLKKQDHTSMAIDLTNNRISLLNKKYKRNGYLTFDDLNKEKETGTVVTITTHYITNI
ncbi:MAG: histidine kinase [Brumimicrobium sp.]|nr:histidine kinase [Brumimicrobium sp.]